MALIDLLAQLNTVNCDSTGIKGTGLAGCRKDRKRVTTIELSPRGFVYEDAQNLAYIRTEEQKSNLIILQGVVSFAEVDNQPTIVTREGSGIKSVAGELPYEYTITFDNGINFYKALRALNSQNQYNFALYDVTGSKFMTQTKAGSVKGFSMGMVFTGQYKGADGTNASGYTMTVQIVDNTEVDTMVWIDADKLDFSPQIDLDGYNDITMNLDTPIAVATTITFTPTLADKTHLVEGLIIGDLRLKRTRTGTTTVIVPSAISYATNPGKVTLTVAAVAAADVYTLETWDGTLLTGIIQQATGTLLKSDVATATVV